MEVSNAAQRMLAAGVQRALVTEDGALVGILTTTDILRAVEVYDRTTRTTVTLSPDDLQLGYRSSILKYRNEKVVVSVSFWLTPGRISRPLRYRELSAAVGVDPGESADSAEVRRTVLGLRAGKGMVLAD